MLPKETENWSLTSLQQRLLKTGGRLMKHARYYWLMLAESHLNVAAVREREIPVLQGRKRLRAMRFAGPKDGALAYTE